MNVAVRRPASKEQAIAIAKFVLPQPYLLFLGDVVEPGFAKTALGLRDWAGERCVAEYALPGAQVSTGLPNLDPKAAAARGARSMVIGVANAGGQIPASWFGALLDALEAGLDLISGMHVRLASLPGLQAAADRLNRQLIDVRTPPAGIPVGTGVKRSGRRLLTVGTDCALGKKYTALAIARALKARGIDATFRATGQTGIMIAGEGMPMDCVVADFIAGAAEILSPNAAADHVDIIEGQGSIFHPSYAGVALGLLQGSQPDRFVVCHEPGRTHLLGHPGFELPSIEQVIEQTIALGRVTNPDIRCAGISLNTAKFGVDEAHSEMAKLEKRLTLPVADSMRGGAPFERLLDACMS
jgi:uncharacterized NAD-dependent epimerase/dehydratase family protein